MCINSVFLYADLAGRPYRAVVFRIGLKEIVEGSDVVSLGHMAVNEKVKAAGQLKVKVPGMETMETLDREVSLTLHDAVTSADLTHMLKVYGVQSLLLVPGKPPLCLRCKRYASALWGSSEEDTNQERFMDISEVVVATGEVPSTAQAEGTPPAPESTATTSNTPDADSSSSPTSKEQQQKAAPPKDSSARPNREDRRDCDQMNISAADANAPKEGTEGKRKQGLPPATTACKSGSARPAAMVSRPCSFSSRQLSKPLSSQDTAWQTKI
ncbi:hypothetical protein HPB47_023994 [Ixodes persulcatus]|uniref:Uncharacterized protein n=1 Tax=Ixodes persulcatus TaxID=34615 RepID=A0AC60Q7N8_IXOPE|nr:hypothetical protein HPB47_023994 [Ixodes persulcatus]